jgi:sec-independent protein translocase protein TatA
VWVPWSSVVLADIFGPDVLIVVILAVVLLFGANRLPKLARSLGEAAKELKQGQEDSTPTAPAAGSTAADDGPVAPGADS